MYSQAVYCDCDGQYEGRRFLTTEERVARLNEYKEWLDAEAKGVQQAIDRLHKA